MDFFISIQVVCTYGNMKSILTGSRVSNINTWQFFHQIRVYYAHADLIEKLEDLSQGLSSQFLGNRLESIQQVHVSLDDRVAVPVIHT